MEDRNSTHNRIAIQTLIITRINNNNKCTRPSTRIILTNNTRSNNHT